MWRVNCGELKNRIKEESKYMNANGNNSGLFQVVSNYLDSSNGGKNLEVEKVNNYVIELRYFRIFMCFVFGLGISFLVGEGLWNHFELKTLAMISWSVCVFCLIGCLCFVFGVVPMRYDHDIPDEYRKVVVNIVKDMFRFLFQFGHWPESISKAEVEHKLGAKLDRIDRRWPRTMDDPVWREAVDKLKFVEGFFSNLTPIRPSMQRRFGQTVRSV